MRFESLLILIAAAAGLAAQTTTQPDVSGTWVEQSKGDTKWVLTEKDGAIHVQEMNGDRVDVDFTCPVKRTRARANRRP